MGLGGLKLAAVTGLLLCLYGWPVVIRGTVLTIGIAGAAAAVLLMRGGHRQDDLAHGPAVVLGAVVAVAIG